MSPAVQPGVAGSRSSAPTMAPKPRGSLSVKARNPSCRSATVSDYALLIENKGSGMSLVQNLRRDGVHAIAVDPSGDKVMRMKAQTARIEAGSVVLPRRAPWLDEFRRELMAFPAGRHDDQVDALSQGLQRAFD